MWQYKKKATYTLSKARLSQHGAAQTQSLSTLLWISLAQNLIQSRLISKVWLSLLRFSQQTQLLSVITRRYPTLISCKSVIKCGRCKQQSICTVQNNWDTACSPESHTWQLPVKNSYTKFIKIHMTDDDKHGILFRRVCKIAERDY